MAKHYEVTRKKMLCPWCLTKTEDGAKCPSCGYQLRNYSDFAFGIKYIKENKELITKFDSVTNQDCGRINELLKDAFYSYHDLPIEWAVQNGSVTALWLLAERKIIDYKEWGRRGWSPNYVEGIGLLCKAASCGSSMAQRMLVTGSLACGTRPRYVSSYSLDHNTGKHNRYIEFRVKDCDMPRTDLAESCNWKDTFDAVAVLSDLADHDIKWAKYVLGRLYFFGNGGLKKDERKGIELITEASKATEDDPVIIPQACQHLCYLHYDGVAGATRDIDKAMKYLARCKVDTVAELPVPQAGGCFWVDSSDKDKFLPWREGWTGRPLCVSGKYQQDWRLKNYAIEGILDRTDLRKDKTRFNYDTYKASRSNWNLQFDITGELDAKQIVALCGEANAKYAGIPAALRLSYNDGKFVSANDRIVFSSPNKFLFVSDFAVPLSKYDFEGTGVSFEDMVKYCAYLRRYLLWDRKIGAKLLVGKAKDNGGECPMEYKGVIRRRNVSEIKSCKRTLEDKKKDDENKEKAAAERAVREKKKRQDEVEKKKRNEQLEKYQGCGCLLAILTLIVLVIWGPEWFSNNWFGTVLAVIRHSIWVVVSWFWTAIKFIAALVCAIAMFIFELVTGKH